MAENEIEEGEAFIINKDDDASNDPDICLSYIEEKVHNLLGHHVKEFDGGISAENLGALYGGYGSFLPMYQRSPIVRPQQKTPQSYTTARSPFNMNSEGASQYSSVPSDVISSVRPGIASRSTDLLLNPKVASADVSATRDSCILAPQGAEKFQSKQKPSVCKLVNPSEQRTLKVRIKVGSGNKSSKNSAIYSGLGLTSPSSSENSPKEGGEMPIRSPGTPLESLGSIYQSVTSFPVPISPLDERMLCLVEKENLPLERKIVLPIKGQQKNLSMLKDDSATMPVNGDLLKGKKKKSGGKNETPDVSKYVNAVEFEDNMSHLKKSKGKETIRSEQSHLNDLKIKLTSNSIIDKSLNDSVKSPKAEKEAGNDVPVKKKEIKKDRGRDITDLPGKESMRLNYGQDCSKNEQLDAKSSSMEHINEQKVRSSCKGFSFVHKDGGWTKGSRAPLVSKAGSDAFEAEKDSIATTMGRFEKTAGLNSTGNELDGKKVVKEKLPFEGKTKSKASENNGKSFGNLPEERVRSGVQASKHDKKSALKEVSRSSCKDVLDGRSECSSEKAKGRKLEAKKQKQTQNDGSSAGAIPLETAPATDASEPTQGWVQCDICLKWRSLLWEMTEDQLPEQWDCSMLYWLPGMNHCDISEDVTTKAVNDLYAVPVPESQVNFLTDVTPNHGKKKHPELADSSTGLMQTSKLRKDCEKESEKIRSLNDTNQHLLKTNLKGDVKHKKLKNKRDTDQYDHEIPKKAKTEVASGATNNWASEEDENFGRVGRKSSSDLPNRLSGKIKQEYDELCHSKNVNHGPKDRLMISLKNQRNSTQISLNSGSLDRKTCDQSEVHAKKRKLRDSQDSQGYLESSKTNGNNLPEGKVYPEGESSDQIFNKPKKSKILFSERNSTSKVDDKPYKNSAVTKIVLTTRDNSVHKACEKDQQTRKNREKVASEGKFNDEYSFGKSLAPERFPVAATSCSSKVSDSCKRAGFPDIIGSPVGSVSSSPMRVYNIDKLNRTRRDVSDKDDLKKGDFFIQTPIKSQDGEANVQISRSGTEKKGEASRNREASRNILNDHDNDARQKVAGKFESKVKHISRSGNIHVVSNVSDMLTEQRKSSTTISFSENSSIEDRISKKNELVGATFSHKSAKESSSGSKDKKESVNLQRVKVKVSDPASERELTKKIHMNKVDIKPNEVDWHPEETTNAKHQFANHSGTKVIKDGMGVGQRDNEILTSDCQKENQIRFGESNVSELKVDDKYRVKGGVALQKNVIQGSEVDVPTGKNVAKVETISGKSDINPCLVGMVDKLAQVHQPLSRSTKGSGLESNWSGASGDCNGPKVLKRPIVHHSVVNFKPDSSVVGDLSGPCAVREDIAGQAAKNALEEAEAAKHLADRLKDSGFDFGYNEAYFEAAMKFLHCASLLEACSSDGKWVGMDQMHAYSIAAKLCETCAQEFENRKEMAAAALAYKCMEVAYFKLVYCKNSSYNKYRHDLETTLQMIPQGESPSSSLSDIDNVNNHAVMDKAPLSKANAHTGNHAIFARNRPNFIKLLDFTNDVNFAMEASRKSHDAFAAANLEKAQNDKDGILSVKKVIDFSFQDVDELVQLVRHARKVISGPSVSRN